MGMHTPTSSCIECTDWFPYLQEARASYPMRDIAAGIVHALKYSGWLELARPMSERMARLRFSPRVERAIDAVVAVPLSARRRRERGFNQAEELARGVARLRGLPLCEKTLVRRRDTRAQARIELDQRRGNVAGAFGIERARMVRDRHLLLVDDVLTTGATALECARVLCGVGARGVSVLTFARARPELIGGEELERAESLDT